MKKLFILLAVTIVFTQFGFTQTQKKDKTEQENKIIFAYFSGYRCPPCMQFRLEYLDDFKNTYKEKYKGRVELVEYMTDTPIGLDVNSAEYKAAKIIAEKNDKLLAELSLYHKLKFIGSIPTIVIGETIVKDETIEKVEAAIDKAIKNNEITKLDFKPLSGKKEDYKNIIEAARAGDYEAVKSFLTAGANVNEQEVVDGKRLNYTPLIVASFSGDKKLVELLLSYHADIDAQTTWGATALTEAAFMGRQEIVELLLSKDADIHAGRNVIVAAAIGTDRPMIQFLKRHGGDVNEQLEDGTTPLIYIVSQRDDGKNGASTKIAVKIADILISEGADVNATDKDGKSVLSYAKSQAMRDFLISKSAK
ncbi:MAG: ankyrin repeat domain-containing protein [Elusimicrobiota bacterium]|jgi:ankyrin repeat protein|nr:ankyrin repeat domain-containing protein [Elusimicrobiota bacterium]